MPEVSDVARDHLQLALDGGGGKELVDGVVARRNGQTRPDLADGGVDVERRSLVSGPQRLQLVLQCRASFKIPFTPPMAQRQHPTPHFSECQHRYEYGSLLAFPRHEECLHMRIWLRLGEFAQYVGIDQVHA